MKQTDMLSSLIQTEQRNQIKNSIYETLKDVDDNIKLAVFRDVMIDQIYGIINKFPKQTQKEIVTIMANKYLNEWNS